MIESLINTEDIMQNLYTGPALKVDVLSEPWHGSLWAESVCCASGQLPFYPHWQGAATERPAIFPSDVVAYRGDGAMQLGYVTGFWRDCRRTPGSTRPPAPEDAPWLLTIFPIRRISDFVQDTDSTRIATEYCMIEEPLEIDVGRVTHRVENMLFDVPTPDDGDPPFILRIFTPSHRSPPHAPYNHRVMAQRDILLADREIETIGRDRLQREFVTRSRTSKRVIAVPTFDFVDGFGLYRNMYRSLLGIYSLPACLPLELRRQQRHHTVITLGPYGARMGDVIAALGPDLRKLYIGCDMLIGGETVLVWSTPLALTGDMVQQNANCGHLSPSANMFCRECLVDRRTCRASVEMADQWMATP